MKKISKLMFIPVLSTMIFTSCTKIENKTEEKRNEQKVDKQKTENEIAYDNFVNQVNDLKQSNNSSLYIRFDDKQFTKKTSENYAYYNWDKNYKEKHYLLSDLKSLEENLKNNKANATKQIEEIQKIAKEKQLDLNNYDFLVWYKTIRTRLFEKNPLSLALKAEGENLKLFSAECSSFNGCGDYSEPITGEKYAKTFIYVFFVPKTQNLQADVKIATNHLVDKEKALNLLNDKSLLWLSEIKVEI
ncbi:hypothetical protein [Mesomycoplasma lagogenitalium]|uniref:Lipoprotein n=1 Tax=Mesomycoplasma lagogenitalium TaxID=171286 RepID=A0ABY8LTG3_9BACT|nr:hypothetical protein [Mesomycoplasma lagogenitalium]WGI36534.1 hypothetical protein QEG99_03655 [Mesomycoplasma lagogenitalium]